MSSYTSRVDTALAYLAGGDSVRAETLFRAVLAEAPDCGAAWHGLACVARHTNQPRLAIASVAHALTLAEGDREKAQFHLTLAAALDEAGHLGEALAACRVVLLLEPREFRAKAFLSELLYRSAREDEAASVFAEALSLAAEPVPLLMRHGAFLMAERRFGAATEAFEALAALCPEDGAAYANLGAARFEKGDMKAAHKALERAVALATPSAQTLNNLGLVCQALGLFAEADLAFARAVEQAPEDGIVAVNRATLLAEIGRQGEAITVFRNAMQGDGALAAQARFNLSMIALASGDFAEGWKLFESRRQVLGLKPFEAPWRGEVTETRVCVEAEQGLGDMIQFLRFVPAAAQRAPLVLVLPEPVRSLLNVTPAMVPLLQSGRVQLEGEASLGCSLLSLPALLGVTQIDPAPYLDFGRAREWGRIGIFRAGSEGYRFDARRSLPKGSFAPLLAVPDLDFVNFQQGDAPDGMAQGVGATLIETARAMACCDLVIGVDTMLAHLAGAMGVPFWLLDREGGDWRWQGPDWYRTMRVFRSEGLLPPAQAWPPVIARVVEALKERSGRDGF
ncbi:tetratricopeptide repeat protein [Asaia sp. HN010]|uniref:tetratricopeptide repeat protein n=1 Tax=Asaia sp. HN010 TaxID=3081233 RepID=UPI00301B2664